MGTAITPSMILAAAGALLAFLVGFYTLIGRERKSPYLINSFFLIALPTVLSAAIAVASMFFSKIESELIYTSLFLFFVALLFTFWRVFKIYIRFVHFVDRISYKDFFVWRWIKNKWRSNRPAPTYEHNTISIDERLEEKLRSNLTSFANENEALYQERHNVGYNSLTAALNDHGESTELLVSLMLTFLEEGHTIQYLAASRHPCELITTLESKIEDMLQKEWRDIARNIVVVDAFSPHFGFTDSIHKARTRKIQSLGVECINTSVSYAGLHTASSRAFNVIKNKVNSDVRSPTLVIYEDTNALADLESHEQYRIFVRHVIPSERMWDGMFTVFAEIAPDDRDWDVLRAYGGICIDTRSTDLMQNREADSGS